MWNGKEFGKIKVMRISKQPSPTQMIHQTQLKYVKYFAYLGSIIATDARCTRKINPELSWHKQLPTRRLFSPANGI